MGTRLNMSRSARRGVAVVGAAVFAVSLSVGGAGSAVAAPTSGPIDSMADMKGTWLTPLTGFREGDPIKWMHQLKVRKVLGSAAVAWEEWLDCEVQAADCTAAKAGKQTGVNWSKPTRVLMVMGPKGVVHGVGATGTILLTPDGDGLSAVMMSSGQRASVTKAPTPTTSGLSPIAARDSSNTGTTPAFGPLYSTQYAASSPSTFVCPSSAFRDA